MKSQNGKKDEKEYFINVLSEHYPDKRKEAHTVLDRVNEMNKEIFTLLLKKNNLNSEIYDLLFYCLTINKNSELKFNVRNNFGKEVEFTMVCGITIDNKSRLKLIHGNEEYHLLPIRFDINLYNKILLSALKALVLSCGINMEFAIGTVEIFQYDLSKLGF